MALSHTEKHIRITRDHDNGVETVIKETHLGPCEVSFNGQTLGSAKNAILSTTSVKPIQEDKDVRHTDETSG